MKQLIVFSLIALFSAETFASDSFNRQASCLITKAASVVIDNVSKRDVAIAASAALLTAGVMRCWSKHTAKPKQIFQPQHHFEVFAREQLCLDLYDVFKGSWYEAVCQAAAIDEKRALAVAKEVFALYEERLVQIEKRRAVWNREIDSLLGLERSLLSSYKDCFDALRSKDEELERRYRAYDKKLSSLVDTNQFLIRAIAIADNPGVVLFNETLKQKTR